jgi:mRNA (guanine-N7-)-methyltransferase
MRGIEDSHNGGSSPVLPGRRKKRSRSPEPHSDAIRASPSIDSTKESSSPRAADVQDGHLAAPASKKVKRDPLDSRPGGYEASPVPITTANLPRFSKKAASDSSRTPRRARTPTDIHSQQNKSSSPLLSRRSRSPSRRSPYERRRERRYSYRRRSPSPKPISRTPSPPPRSPPRKLKRPGGTSRISATEREALRQRQIEREQEEIRDAQRVTATRGVHDVVKQHYNTVPQRGREWRNTASKIRGLRSFNNWVKSSVIQKFSPCDDYTPGSSEQTKWAEGMEGGGFDGMHNEKPGLLVLDIGCGKGGDLGKWAQAPQPVELYVGVDPADVSIEQARERYRDMRDSGGRGGRGGRGGWGGFRGGRGQKVFEGHFFVKDAYGEWLGDIPLIRDVGIDPGVGPGIQGAASARWGGGGFDVVSMMFCMHYAFESPEKARGMLRNVAGSLKKGGRFIGVIPNSDILSERVVEFHKSMARNDSGPPHVESDGGGVSPQKRREKEEGEAEEVAEWGNSIYRVRFPGKTPKDGVFRPPFGWKYSYFMEESVEDVPEYVVPWEAFRA